MDNKTKLILTAVGLSAVIVPAIFLFFLSSSGAPTDTNAVGGSGRQIDRANIEREINSGTGQAPQTTPSPFSIPSLSPSPSPSPSPTSVFEGTGSAF